jgi:hypothetical protein
MFSRWQQVWLVGQVLGLTLGLIGVSVRWDWVFVVGVVIAVPSAVWFLLDVKFSNWDEK